jgi:hypothetical protein
MMMMITTTTTIVVVSVTRVEHAFNSKGEGKNVHYLLLKCTVIKELSMLHVFKITDLCMVTYRKSCKSGHLTTV